MLCVDRIALRQGRHFDVDDVGVLQLPTKSGPVGMLKTCQNTSNYITGFSKHQLVQHFLGNFAGS